MKKIPIAKPFLGNEEAQAAYDTILTGWVTQGPKVAEFEERFAEYVGAKHAVALSNCTTALHLCMLLAGVEEGDEVICPSMSFIATANSIRYVGAKPVFAEVGEDFNLCLEDTKKKITDKTKAILLVHQLGMPADIESFTAFCKDKNIVLIEDAACAIGSDIEGKRIGSHSDLVCFSLHPRKIITTGDGGMITTSNDAYNEKLRLLRQHGMSVNDRKRHESKKVIFETYDVLGYNYRMTDIQGAVGVEQLKKLDTIVTERRRIAYWYHDKLAELEDKIRLPRERKGIKSNYQSYQITLLDHVEQTVPDIMQAMLDKGISTRRGVMLAHKEPAYTSDNNLDLPHTHKMNTRSMILPLYLGMTEEDVDRICNELKSHLKG
ncbi:MAG: DegT/DnrJ/EryC1/StrS family aminotransferase [Saprospiraceae bacterium]|nr:DegT/DnrJ/EryC1/StrS family aminotransferase [Saprospiraceae bacterium]